MPPTTDQPEMCEELPWDAPIRQCHIFTEVSASESPVVGMVITSDCDIAQSKHRDCLTWVPVVPAPSYVASLWAQGQIAPFAKALRANLAQAVCRHREKRSLPGYETKALEDWVNSVSEATLLVPFQCESEKDTANRVRDKWLNAATSLEKYRQFSGRALPDRTRPWSQEEVRTTLEMFWELRDAATPGAGRKGLEAEISSAIVSPAGGDVFALHGLPGALGGVMHVALLRFLREVEFGKIAGSLHHGLETGAPYYRMGALLSPYRYSLTRRLAAVFSDIGLPDLYETHSRRVAKLVAAELAKAKGDT